MLGSAERPEGTVRPLSSIRRPVRLSANRVKDGHTLGTLRATGGPPAGVQQTSAGLVRPDGGRRNASLFDLPSSGQGLVNRLRAQVRPSSPLLGLTTFGLADDPGEPSPTEGGSRAELDAAISIQASLRSAFSRLDNRSRLLLSMANANRTSGGFGLAAITNRALDLIG